MERRASLCALLLGGLAGCGLFPSDDVYAKPYDMVYAELAATSIPHQLSSALPGATPRVVRNPGMIVWHFANLDGDVATFTATIARVDDHHTRVTVEAKPGKAMDPQVGRLLGSPTMVGVTRVAMEEQVAAELDDRPFDKLAYGTRLTAYMNAHPQDMIGTGNAIRDTMNDVAMQANGYPSKGARNYRPSLSDQLNGAVDNSAAYSSAKPVADTLDPQRTTYESTHPATDLSAYR